MNNIYSRLIIILFFSFGFLFGGSFDNSDRAVKRVYETESRYALVIGNNNYSNLSTLKNAVNDSRDIANALKDVGFDVIELTNVSRSEMLSGLKRFTNKLSSNGGVGMVFYSGHGIETGGVNYLVPIDANIEDKYDIRNSSLSLDEVLSRLESAGNRLNIVVLDACRNDPFTNRSVAKRVIGENRGLVQPPEAKGIYIAYSASAGKTASDGTGGNGTFTKHLLKNIKSGLPLNDVFKFTRVAVQKETAGEQTPASYDMTVGEFFFKLPTNINNKVESISTYSVEDVKRTEYYLTVDKTPFDSKITIENTNKKYIDNILLPKANYSLLIERNGYLSKRIKIDLQNDLNIDVALEKIVEPVKQKVKTESSLNSSRFTIRSATFIDNKTGYMWEKPKIVGNWNWDSFDDRYNFSNKYGKNWNDAKSYCENLNLDGYSDWKLPSRDELHTLMTVNYGEYNSGWQTWFDNNKHKRNNFLFVPEEISNFMVPWIWTRDISETYSSNSWVVDFSYGGGSWNSHTSDDYFVVCVRDL